MIINNSRTGFKSQQGYILPLLLVFLFIGIALIAPTLLYASSTLKLTKIDEDRMASLYAADAGVQDAIWKLKYQPTNANIPIVQDTAGPIYSPNLPGTVNDLKVQIYAKTIGDSVKTYGIFSTATKNGKSVGVEEYVSYLPAFFSHAAISPGNITIQPGSVINGDVMGTVSDPSRVNGDIYS